MLTPSVPAKKVFYCYAREDEPFLLELEKHLKRQTRIVSWYDRKILPGQEWEEVIDAHLHTADLIVLLISPDFLASDYCYGSEMKRALERHEAGEVHVLPILLRHTFYENTPLDTLAVLPANGLPVVAWPHQDEAFVEIAAEVQRILQEQRVQKQSPPHAEKKPVQVVFVSAQADRAFLHRFKADLEKAAMISATDLEALEPGTSTWEEQVRTAIRAADLVLLIASPHARTSQSVRDALRLARMYQRVVYPVWANGAQWMEAVPLGWGGLQYIDARQSQYRSGVRAVLSLLEQFSSRLPSIVATFAFEPRNPYKGLRAFAATDASDFFGRDDVVAQLATTIEELLQAEKLRGVPQRLVALLGTSGSGKSSVLYAGLLPCLQSGGG